MLSPIAARSHPRVVKRVDNGVGLARDQCCEPRRLWASRRSSSPATDQGERRVRLRLNATPIHATWSCRS